MSLAAGGAAIRWAQEWLRQTGGPHPEASAAAVELLDRIAGELQQPEVDGALEAFLAEQRRRIARPPGVRGSWGGAGRRRGKS